jgi:integrase
VANLVRLLLLTGARKNEIAQCKWSWVELDSHKICLPDSKTGAKSLFLSDGAIQVLRDQRITSRDPSSEYVFPGGKQGAPIVNLYKPWGLICDECNLAKVRIHDLRHTAASIAVGQGIALPIIGKLLGHSQAQTTARYAHVGNDPALAAANAVGTALGASIM